MLFWLMANIFFGVPSENNVTRNINRWMNMAGGPPVIFAEHSDRIPPSKKVLRYEVVTIDEALAKFPDAHVWVTYRRADNTANTLLKKLPPERVHFLEADLEYRMGCSYLGHFISYRKENFSPCCVTGKAPVVTTSGSIRQRFEHWHQYTEKLVDDIRNKRTSACEKCHLLKYGFWRKTVKLSEVSFGSNNPGDVCNFKCIYCFSKNSLERLKDDIDGFTTYEVLKQIAEMPEFDNEDFTIQLSNGEFTCNKHCESMLDILLEKKWKVKLVSNMSVWRDKLATLMETGRVIKLLTSLDAGTPETFKKVRGVNVFDRVIANLKRYPVRNINLILKYTFMEGINDNETDVDKFYEIVKEVGCKTIVLSSDQQIGNPPFTDKMRGLSLRLIKKAKADDIKMSANSSYLHPIDAKFISENYAANNIADAKTENNTRSSGKIKINRCPLCNEKEFTVDKTIKFNDLINKWITKRGFNPIDDIYKNDILERRKCENCDLRYYNYYLPDSEELYRNLENINGYYPQFRSTFRLAYDIIKRIKPQTLLEVGSGNGAFLEYVQDIVPEVTGNEYNKDAAEKCKERGLKILTHNLDDITETFDVICHHEVLEHIFDTEKFLQQTLVLLNKGGKLIIGTPDPEGIISITGTNELFFPPHHQFDFSKKTFDWLAGKYGLKIYDYVKTELGQMQYQKYIAITKDNISYDECRKKFTGHSHVVVFEKIR